MLSTMILNASIVVPVARSHLENNADVSMDTNTSVVVGCRSLLSRLSLQLHMVTKEWCAWTDCWLAAWLSLDDRIHIRLDVGSPSASSRVAVGCEPCGVGIRTMERLQTDVSKGDSLWKACQHCDD